MRFNFDCYFTPLLAATIKSIYVVCSAPVKPSRATVAFASVSSDSTLRTIAFDCSARHGTETICSGRPALTKIDQDDSGWVLVLPKLKKPFPGKVSRLDKEQRC